MNTVVDKNCCFAKLGSSISKLANNGYKNIMLFQAEGGIPVGAHFKQAFDKASVASANGVHIFGGVFPGIFDRTEVMDTGAILVGIKTEVHFLTLEQITLANILPQIEKGLAPIEAQLRNNYYQTLFVFGDGFGENNLHLVNGLNHIVQKYPLRVIGGLTGRNKTRMSHFTIFTPHRVIQNGAILAFTRLSSSIGTRHGWEPLEGSRIEVTQTNGCFIEKLNGFPAYDRYIKLITTYDERGSAILDQLNNAGDFFNLAVQYPLGLIRKHNGQTTYIDRTPLGVGPDKSLQFSAEIPAGTRACILQLPTSPAGNQYQALSMAAKHAYQEAKKNFPPEIKDKRVIMMDCYGRKLIVERMGRSYSEIELMEICQDQALVPHSPIGVLTFGELSSMDGNYVELHNKTTVVGFVEDY